MKKALITGAGGFIGRNLAARLSRVENLTVFRYDLDNNDNDLREWLSQADVVFHLAGVNRPERPDDYDKGNAGFTDDLCRLLRELGRTPKIVMSSSVQAELDNPYGLSKRRAEDILRAFSKDTGAAVSIFRLKNVFGKWGRPNYNSVTATFCHNIAHDLPISISDPAREIELVYIDDVTARLAEELDDSHGLEAGLEPDGIAATRVTLGELAGRIQAFREMNESLMIPDFSERFNQQLYATYLSYVEPMKLEYGLTPRTDARGSLAEFVKSSHFGQVFLSRTNPGITRGNHYHDSKTEKFLVLSGEGLIQMRHIESDQVVAYRVRGEDYRVIDIPPGYTHSITNVGVDEMVTLFWASEVFDPDCPDTYYQAVAPVQEYVGEME